jgi:hypothetical protein
MNQSRSLSDLSVTELRKVLQIKEQIVTLETQLKAVLGASGAAAFVAAPTPKPIAGNAGKRGGRRQLSPEARERIAAAQRARWAASRGDGASVKVKPAKPVAGKRGGRRTMSPEARERIAAAQRARWAAQRGGKPATKSAAVVKPAKVAKAAKAVKVAKVAGKRGGRRTMSPEARERIAAAQRARWAAQRGGKPAAAVKPAKVAKVAGKRGGRRQLSPEARERIAAAQRARWAAVRKSK